jgi:hypothetical protein
MIDALAVVGVMTLLIGAIIWVNLSLPEDDE